MRVVAIMPSRRQSPFRSTSGPSGRLNPSRRSASRGVVLILAIFAVALLTTLAVGITTAVRVELKAAHAGLERTQELFLAQAGIDLARAILVYEDPSYDTLSDAWGPYAELPLDQPQELGEGYYRVRVHDACGRIDLNRADYETLVRLTDDPDLAQEILRWREGQANAEQYLSLPYPYPPRQGAFQTVGELLLVQGMTPELFFGTEEQLGLVDLLTVEAISPNTDANGESRTSVRTMWVAINERPGWFEEYHANLLELADMETWKRIFGYSPPDSANGSYESLAQLAEVLESYGALEALDYLTVSTDAYLLGLVNVNTASPEVLAALPGGSPEFAQAVLERRQAEPFVSLGDVAQFLSSQEEGAAVLSQMIDRVTTKSSSFVIESTGAVGRPPGSSVGGNGTGGSFRTVCAYVRRIEGNVHVLAEFEEDEPLPPYEETIRLAARR